MFWKFNLLTSTHIDTLLDKEDVTLHELMDEDDILQECKAQNRKLVDFLILPENMESMVNMITTDPSEEVEEKVRFKYPNTACELLTSDVSQINDKLAGDEELVDKLYSFLESDQPLNPLLASFFSKVMGLLITRKSEMIFEYLKSRKDFVGSLLRHIGTSAIMDLLLRLITCIESITIRRAVIDWLNEQKVVERLVASIVPEKDEDIHCNAAQSLCDIVRLGREQIIQQQDSSDPDPLLVTMELEETVSQLLTNMLDTEKNESVLVNGLFVIHTLLEVRRQGLFSGFRPEGNNDQMSALDTDRLSQGVNSVLSAITPRLKDFHNLLLDPPKQRFCAMPTTAGHLDPPLGNTRLQIAKLITALISTNTHSVNTELANLNTVHVLLDLYFKYIWNNFLHTQVEQCLSTILTNLPVEIDGRKQHPLLAQLFSGSKIIQRLTEEWQENDNVEGKENGKRKGFMGHLTKMANALVSAMEKGDNCELVKDQFTDVSDEEKQKWEKFVSSSLADTNKKNTIELLRNHTIGSSSEDDDADFKDIPFPQDTAMQQAFSDYQLQQMTSTFIDQFGFNEEEFAEQEEKIDAPFNERISSIDFNITADEENNANTAMFEQACNSKIQQFDDNDSDEDIWEEKPLTFDKSSSQNINTRPKLQETRGENSSEEEESTDSEEELDSPRVITQKPSAEKMDVDGGWVANFEDANVEGDPVAMDTASPWDNVPVVSATDNPDKWAEFTNKVPATAEAENWADFTSFPPKDNTTSKKDSPHEPRNSSPIAMDTSDSTRSSAYLVQSASANLENQLLEASKTDKKDDVTLTDVSESTEFPKQVPVDKDSNMVSTVTSEKSTTNESVPVTVANDNKAKLEASVSNKTSPTDSTQSPKDNFLASSGLMKAKPCLTTTSPKSGGDAGIIQDNGPTIKPVDTNDAITEARTQAKEALENYDAALTDSNVKNGPV
ncbi:serine/threonine-protein phosphatase 6 regulatory subunit 3 isoform X2 [Patella vulgata]|uniref:serine/threonine-protein phosphatase 6 regulatory subunit 3 isoform X2 n=1 Tax=Patella vulgata TaxID=6465 RepID=UPI00217F3856|nr:serine/threonine-protein phosphatase 6 regulatory subunit 3 isoform X2 [Patella vulgata]